MKTPHPAGGRAFLFTPTVIGTPSLGGVYTPIDFPGASMTVASGINNTGQIAGEYKDSTGYSGFSLSGGVYTSIDVPGAISNLGFNSTQAFGINDAGQIVGYYYDSTGFHGFLFSGGVYTPIDVPGAAVDFTEAFGINNAGQIVGFYKDSTGVYGFLNNPPLANAGQNQTVHAGAIVTLDGSGSNSPTGNLPLTHAWEITAKPAGSTATLSDPVLVNPFFTPDKMGDYVVKLVVTDSLGRVSAPAIVTISTSNSAPVAEAGPDQSFRVIGPPVQLDGTQSYDENGDPITYRWTLLSVPEGSAATLANPTFVNPTFTPDKMGDYVVELVVNDPWMASAPDTVTISFKNVKPVANAGTNQSVVLGVPSVTLNGSASTDADGDPLTYNWGLTNKPANSVAILTNPTTVNPAFTPDVPGDYTAQLIVNDGFLNSDAATVPIHVATSRSWVSDQLRNVIADLGNTALLPDSALKNKNLRNTLITKLNVIIKDVDAGNYAEALAKLQADVMAKTNGCAETLPPAPDNNDWIVTCTYQSIIYPELQEILACITELAK